MSNVLGLIAATNPTMTAGIPEYREAVEYRFCLIRTSPRVLYNYVILVFDSVDITPKFVNSDESC